MQLHFSMVKVKDLIERISAAIRVRYTIRCALYSALEAYYRAHYPISTTLTVFSVKYNAITFFNFKVKDLIGRISAAIGVR
jgi:4'-phosphopantetheinyl transferase EntD